jgi:hypothetical protein
VPDPTPDTERRRRRLAALEGASFNYDHATLVSDPSYSTGERRFRLAREAPGGPAPGGPWQVARQLVADYAFADPRRVRPFYEPDSPRLGRTMMLRLQALNLIPHLVGVRVREILDEQQEGDGDTAQVWGWTYGTLEGHVEQGEMSWQAWKWLDSGLVEFRISWTSKTAAISNPFIALGFRILEPHERPGFLASCGERMQRLTAEGAR